MSHNKLYRVIFVLISLVAFATFYWLFKEANSATLEILISLKGTKSTETQFRYKKKSDSKLLISRNTLFASQFYKEYSYVLDDPNEISELVLSLGDTANTIFIDQLSFVYCTIGNRDTFYRWVPSSCYVEDLMASSNHVTVVSQNSRYLELEAAGIYPIIKFRYEHILAELSHKDQFGKAFGLILSAMIFAFFVFLTLSKSPIQQTSMKYSLCCSRYQLLVYLFVGLLGTFFLNAQFHVLKDMPNSENRTLSKMPKFHAKSLFSLPDLYNSYIEEHYSCRNFLFFVNSILHAKLFQESSLPNKVIMGKKGWFFYNETTTVSDFRRLTTIDTNEVKNVLNILISRLQWMKKRHIKYYILVPPNKERIYPGFMPDAYFKVDNFGHNRLDFYKKMVEQYTEATIIDPSEALERAATRRDVYYSTDTHWNLFGGFIGYQILMNEVVKDFPQVEIAQEKDFELNDYFISEGDLSSMLALQNIYRRKEVAFTFLDSTKKLYPARPMEIISAYNNVPIDSSQLKLVMFRDSYANYLIPFLNLNFKRAVYIWNYEFMPDLIEKEKPDVVVFESLERFISYALTIPNPPRVDQELKK